MPPIESLERLADAFAALERPVERKRMLVIVNPYATTVSDRLKNLVVYALQGRYEVDAMDTEGRDHATVLCREAAQEGYDVVVAFGGDGTVNEAANGLAHSPTPLTCLPGGATNVYCKMLGVPGDIVDATEHLLRARRRLGPARAWTSPTSTAARFTFSAGYGLDASVVRARRRPSAPEGAPEAVVLRLRRRSSTFTREYVVRPPRLEAHVGGEVLRGVTALVQNADPYTYFGNRPVARRRGPRARRRHHRRRDARARGADRHPHGHRPAALRSAAPGAPQAHQRLHHLRGAAHRLGRRAPVALQVDGDYIGDTVEAVFGVWPEALTVIA